MAEVVNKPFLSYLFKYLEKQNVSHVILSLGYKSEIVIEWLSMNNFTFKVSYVVENEPLGTGGAIKYAMSKAESSAVFVINGDTFFDVELGRLEDFHRSQKSDITLALKPMISFDRYGSVELDSSNKIIKFNEKQFCESGLINGGVYLINKDMFEQYDFGNKFSFEKQILENYDLKLSKLGYREDKYFIDIGIPSDYEKANIDFMNF